MEILRNLFLSIFLLYFSFEKISSYIVYILIVFGVNYTWHIAWVDCFIKSVDLLGFWRFFKIKVKNKEKWEKMEREKNSDLGGER